MSGLSEHRGDLKGVNFGALFRFLHVVKPIGAINRQEGTLCLLCFARTECTVCTVCTVCAACAVCVVCVVYVCICMHKRRDAGLCVPHICMHAFWQEIAVALAHEAYLCFGSGTFWFSCQLILASAGES